MRESFIVTQPARGGESDISFIIVNNGVTRLTRTKNRNKAWAELDGGCYILRTNVTD
jgi:hypothetical protein